MSHGTITVIENRSGKRAEFPIIEGTMGQATVDISVLNSELGYLSYDPGFISTASCKSAITFIDGDAGILLYRGYPIEQLAERSTFLEVAYLLMNEELPTRAQLDEFAAEIGRHANIHEALRHFFSGFHYDAHPMAMMVGVVGSLSAFYHSELNMRRREHRRMSAMRLLAKMPTIAAACYRHSIGMPFVYPRGDRSYCENFLNMMFSIPGQTYYIDPLAAKVLNLLLILHADHEQNASTSTVRLASSTGANPCACIAGGIAALWGPAHGGANESVLQMLAKIGEISRITKYGVDVWLNNPRRPLEASGTSGQQVVLNGGLNLSILDGWWTEAFDGSNGFAIGRGETHTDTLLHDRRDAEALYGVLREEVIPLYYQRDADSLPRGWIARMKRAIRTLGWLFNAYRMVMDFVRQCYIPAAGGTSCKMP